MRSSPSIASAITAKKTTAMTIATKSMNPAWAPRRQGLVKAPGRPYSDFVKSGPIRAV
jgi:hypothetical protein